MQFSHYSDKAITLSSIKSMKKSRDGNFKPQGLWLSVDGLDDWKQWCIAEEFRLDYYVVRQQIVLDESKFVTSVVPSKGGILYLSSVEEIHKFDSIYHLELYPGDQRINWSLVMEDYGGIVISPYQWSLRLSGMMWYYPWDCASGCIWNKDMIISIGEPEVSGWKVNENSI